MLNSIANKISKLPSGQNSIFSIFLLKIGWFWSFEKNRFSFAFSILVPRTVQLKQIVDNRYILDPIMKLVLLLDESRGLSEEERVRSAFSLPENENQYHQNIELFNSYSRGGILMFLAVLACVNP